ARDAGPGRETPRGLLSWRVRPAPRRPPPSSRRRRLEARLLEDWTVDLRVYSRRWGFITRAFRRSKRKWADAAWGVQHRPGSDGPSRTVGGNSARRVFSALHVSNYSVPHCARKG